MGKHNNYNCEKRSMTHDHINRHISSFLEAVRFFHDTGLMESVERTTEAYTDGGTPWPISYAFMPDEVCEILERGRYYIVLSDSCRY